MFSDARKADFLEHVPVALHALTSEGTIAWVNATWCEWLGWNATEVIGQPIIKFLTPESIQTFHRNWPQLQELGVIKDVDAQFLRKDGTIFLSTLDATAVRDSRGNLEGTRAVFVDRHMQNAIDQLREYLWLLPDALVLVGENGTISFANDQALKMFGYSDGDLVGTPIERLIPEGTRARHAAHREDYFAQPTVRPMGAARNLMAQRRDGSLFPVEISLAPIRTETGSREAMAAIRDISKRRRLEDEAQAHLQRLLDAVEITSDAFIVFDPNERIVLCNSAARALFCSVISGPIVGVSHDQLLQAMRDQQFLVVGADNSTSLYDQLCTYHQAPSGHIDIETTAGQFLRITCRRTPEGGTVSILADLTEDRQRELDIREARQIADRASRAKSEFLASMSHELRTPLNAILGFAQLLLRDKRAVLEDHQQEYVHHILTSGDHLLRLIDDVLDLSRIEAGGIAITCTGVRVRDILGEVVRTLDPQAANKNIRLTVDDPIDVSVTADHTRLRQILLNFGSNAIKYGRQGGALSYAVSRQGDRVRISAGDDGPGIPLDKQPGLFQPFNRAGQELGPVEGTGIGLSISKLLAERMGGSVGFKSTAGRGSEFWVELTLTEPILNHATPRGTGSPAIAPHHAHLYVVYIEDNPANLAFMRAVFLSLEPNIELATAPTAEVGLDLIRSRPPDLVILDINLPGMSGFDALGVLKSAPDTAVIPVLGLSSAASPRDVNAARRAGFWRYLTKPVNVDELRVAIEDLTGHPMSR